MHIAGACHADGPPPTFDDIEQMVRLKMPDPAPPASGSARSLELWSSDLGRRPALRPPLPSATPAKFAPGDDATVSLDGTGDVLSFDRDRTVVETWFGRGLRGRSVGAGVQGSHHCMVDGISVWSAHRPAGHRSGVGPVEGSNRGRQPLSRRCPRCWGHGAGWQPTSTQAHRVGICSGPSGGCRSATSWAWSPEPPGWSVLTATPQSPIDGSIGPPAPGRSPSASFDDVGSALSGGTVTTSC